jgi:AcrR family transcriptional regulator
VMQRAEDARLTREKETMAYRATERQQRRQAMRTRLLDAARVLFMRQGYAATTMPQVVQQAGTSIGNCYFYFANKEALLRGVVEEFAQQIAQEIDVAAMTVPAGPAQLAVALVRGVEVALEQKELARVLLVETRQPELRSLVLEYFAARLPDFLGRGGVAYPARERRQIALAYQGSVFQVLEAVMTGELQEDARALGRFLARWNLQALGLPSEAVEQGLAALDTMRVPAQTRDVPPATS